MFCRKDNKEFYHKWCNINIGTIDPDDSFDWNSFIDLFDGEVLTADDEWKRIQKARCVLGYVADDNQPYYMIKRKGSLLIQTLSEAKRGMKEVRYQIKSTMYGEDIINNRDLFTLISQHRHLITYDKAEFHPYSRKQPSALPYSTINLFSGIPLPLLPVYDEKRIAIINEFLLRTYCGEDEDSFHRLIMMKAHQLQYPRRALPVNLYINNKTKEGEIKAFIEWEANCLYGFYLYLIIDKLPQSSNVELICRNKIHIAFCDVDKKTVDRIISATGIIGNQSQRYRNYTIVSSDASVFVKGKSNTDLILKGSGHHAKEHKIWRELEVILDQDTASHWYTYLMTKDVSTWQYNNITTPESLDLIHIFLDHYAWSRPMLAVDLQAEFTEFCTKRKYPVSFISLNSFVGRIKAYPLKSFKRGQNKNYYYDPKIMTEEEARKRF